MNENGWETRDMRASQRKWGMILIGVFVFLVCAGGLAAGLILMTGICSRAAQSDVPSPPCDTGIVCVIARQVALDYRDNEVAADAKYKNKTVRISGRIEQIGRTTTGEAYVEFKTGVGNNAVRCYFDAQNEYLLVPFSQNDLIWVQGTGAGWEYLPDRIFKRALFTNGTQAARL